MNIFKRYHLLSWILAFLVIVIVSAATSYIIFNSGILNNEKPARDVKPGTVLQSELSLTPDQTVLVERINTTYNETTAPFIAAIQNKKVELLDELSKEQADTNRLSKIADELCIAQKKLQKANIRQFLELKKVCNTDQTKKLSQIYSELYGCKEKGKSNGNEKGMRRRHRYGQQRQNN